MPPKRQRTDSSDGDKPSKKPKRNEKQVEHDSSDEEIAAAAEGRKNKDHWDIIDGDLDAPTLGQPDASKLKFTFQKKSSDPPELKEFVYTKPIDWNDKKSVTSLAKWRRSHIVPYGFPLERIVTGWLPIEEAWLELLFRLLEQRLDNNQLVRRPTNQNITDHFNSLFVGRKLVQKKGKPPSKPRKKRGVESISSKLKKANSLGELVRATKARCSDDRDLPLQLPVITWEQLLQYVIYRELPGLSEGGDATQESGEDSSSLEKQQGAADEAEAGEDGGQFMGVDAGQPMFVDGVEEHSQGTTTSDDKDEPTVVPEERVMRLAETAAVLTSAEEIEGMVNDGWSILFHPHIETAVQTTKEPTDTLEDSWLKYAVEEFDDRWYRSYFGYGETTTQFRSPWYADGKSEPIEGNAKKSKAKSAAKPSKGSDTEMESGVSDTEEMAVHGEKDSALHGLDQELMNRRPRAQHVNALLAYASCPPLGYAGELNALARDKALPQFELALAKKSEKIQKTHTHNYWANHPDKS